MWEYGHGSQERGQAWENIAENLNKLALPKFKVTQRSIRDLFAVLLKNHKVKFREEEKASGISPEHSELDDGMMNIIQRFEEADRERDRVSEQKKKEKEVENEKAEDFRKAPLETTFGESRKKKDAKGSESTSKRQRATGSDTIQFLRERSKQDFEFREEEFEIKRRNKKVGSRN